MSHLVTAVPHSPQTLPALASGLWSLFSFPASLLAPIQHRDQASECNGDSEFGIGARTTKVYNGESFTGNLVVEVV